MIFHPFSRSNYAHFDSEWARNANAFVFPIWKVCFFPVRELRWDVKKVYFLFFSGVLKSSSEVAWLHFTTFGIQRAPNWFPYLDIRVWMPRPFLQVREERLIIWKHEFDSTFSPLLFSAPEFCRLPISVSHFFSFVFQSIFFSMHPFPPFSNFQSFHPTLESRTKYKKGERTSFEY